MITGMHGCGGLTRGIICLTSNIILKPTDNGLINYTDTKTFVVRLFLLALIYDCLLTYSFADRTGGGDGGWVARPTHETLNYSCALSSIYVISQLHRLTLCHLAIAATK